MQVFFTDGRLWRLYPDAKLVKQDAPSSPTTDPFLATVQIDQMHTKEPCMLARMDARLSSSGTELDKGCTAVEQQNSG